MDKEQELIRRIKWLACQAGIGNLYKVDRINEWIGEYENETGTDL